MKALLGPFRKKGGRTIKVTVHGYDCWNLNHTLAVIAYPLLKKFREIEAGHPGGGTQEEWNEILDRMIWSMKIVADEKDCCPSGSIVEIRRFYKKVNSGLELFGKHFRSLWY